MLTERIIGIGQASISGGNIIGLKFVRTLNQALICGQRLIITLGLKIGFRETKARSDALRVDLNGMYIGVNSIARVVLYREPCAEMFPGFRIFRVDRDDTPIDLYGLIAFTHLLIHGCEHIITSAPLWIK